MAVADFGRLIPKTWVRFNGSGTVAIDDSENVDSITDNGTGDYTVNITADFNAANYAFAFGGRDSVSKSLIIAGDISTASAIGSHRIVTTRRSDGANIDPEEVAVCYFGDLA